MLLCMDSIEVGSIFYEPLLFDLAYIPNESLHPCFQDLAENDPLCAAILSNLLALLKNTSC